MDGEAAPQDAAMAEVLADPARLSALEQSGVLDGLPEAAFDRAVRLARRVLDVPVSLVSFVDDTRQVFKALDGLEGPAAEARGTPLSHSFCQHVVVSDAALVVEDARDDPRLCDNLAIRDLDVVAYLGVPIRSPDGHTLGSFCAIDSQPRAWSDDDLSTLRDIADTVESEIGLRRAVAKRQLLNRELNHRVGNLFSVIGGMITMTARHADTPQEMSDTLRGRIAALAKAHDLIRPDVMDTQSAVVPSALQTTLASLIGPHVIYPDDQLALSGPMLSLGAQATTDLSLVVHELATNAAKYGALSVPGGKLDIRWDFEGDAVRITWIETGGPPIKTPPITQGFGSQLIKISASGGLGGRVTSEWHDTGVQHDIYVAQDRFVRS